jgi:hypothetical protein
MEKAPSRRSFLRGSSMLMGGLAAGPFQALFANHARGAATRAAASPDYGPLNPVADQTTGLKLIKLPKGFEYATFGWAGDPLSDGAVTPGVHDGMAVVWSAGPLVLLVRNHEIRGARPPSSASTRRRPPTRGAAEAGPRARTSTSWVQDVATAYFPTQ